MSDQTEATAQQYDQIAAVLEEALAHVRTAAQHFRDELVPQGAAHAWAAHGHLLEATERLNAQAREHARHSQP